MNLTEEMRKLTEAARGHFYDADGGKTEEQKAEADARKADIADLREIAQAAKERERARLMAECPEEVAAEDARMRKIKERLRVNMAALDGTLAASGKPS